MKYFYSYIQKVNLWIIYITFVKYDNFKIAFYRFSMAGSGMKSLAKDTAIYGLSSILGRLFNWFLVPLHMYVFINPVEFGKISYMYGYTALLFILLTYGLETGFFRFMNKKDENADMVYSSSLISLAFTSGFFILLCFIFINPIAGWMEYTDHADHILMMAIIVALDAFMCIPYAYLRYQKRPIRFVSIRLAFIFLNIFFNVFFLAICPYIHTHAPSTIDWFYNPSYGIGYVFLANLISTFIVLLLFLPQFSKFKFGFDIHLLKRILIYSFPLLILGLAGVINQAVAQLIYPHIFGDNLDEAYKQLGIYSACLKLTVVISMFTQAFRYAYEPFIFAKNKENNSDTKAYSEATKYFIIFALVVFLAVVYFIELLRHIGRFSNYMVGLDILPPAMMGEIFFGIYFNLSIWYKLTDKTQYGAAFSILGCIITVAINIIFVPIVGYIASAWATFFCNLIIMTISYFFGQKYYPIRYDLKSFAFYLVLASILYLAGMYLPIANEYLKYIYRLVLLIIFVLIIIKKDLPLSQIPYLNKFINKNN